MVSKLVKLTSLSVLNFIASLLVVVLGGIAKSFPSCGHLK